MSKPWERDWSTPSESSAGPKPWERTWAAEAQPVSRGARAIASDLAKGLGGAVVSAVGAVPTAVGRAVQEGGETLFGLSMDEARRLAEADGTPEKALEWHERANRLNPISAAGRAIESGGQWIGRQGDRLRDSRSDEAKKRARQSTPDGDLMRPSTWTMGENPTVEGVAQVTADVIGSMAPPIAAAIATRGRSATTQMRVGGATVAGQIGGAAMEEAGDYLSQFTDDQLRQASPVFRDLEAKGYSAADARTILSRDAENRAATFAAPVGYVGGQATAAILGKPGERLAGGFGSMAAKAGILGALGATEEGLQEVAEGVATRAGINNATGMDRSLTEGTFGEFILGAKGGGVTGAGKGVLEGLRARQSADGAITDDGTSPTVTPEGGNMPPAAAAPEAPLVTSQSSDPTSRLAELDILAEQRDLTPAERQETIDLLTALQDEQDATQGTEGDAPQAPAVEAPKATGGDGAAAAGVPAEPAAPNVEAAGLEPEREAAKRTNFWTWIGTKGYKPADVKVGTPLHAELKAEFDALRNGQPLPSKAQPAAPSVDPVAAVTAWRERFPAKPPSGMSEEQLHQFAGERRNADAQLVQQLEPQANGLVLPTATGFGGITQDPSEAGKWRITRFDAAMEPVGHEVYNSAREAIENLLPRFQAPRAKQAEPILPPLQPQPSVDLQNRDRSRAASVVQMSDIARNPDYMRLGPSRTPDSGAPMVFAVGDDVSRIPAENFGRQDVAVMSDGQRVPFRYAVVDATKVNPSNFADGRQNPEFSSTTPGTIKALNNGRTAGVRAAHEMGTAGEYVAGMQADEAMHGIPADVIARTPNPMLVRVYSDAANTANMAAKSQGQGLGMSPAELARQDAPLMDSSVLGVYEPGEITSAANRDFVRAFIGKLQAAGQDVAGMMTGDGQLSQDGRKRIQAALMQAAYGDVDLVEEMFDSTDTDIKAIGEALKAVAGQWANMRDSARLGVINPQVDVTENLVQAVNLIRKARRERMSLKDLVAQPDLMTGETPHALTVGILRVFYDGQNFTRAVGRDKVVAKLEEYIRAAMATSADAGLFGGEPVSPADILATITGQGALDAQTQPEEGRGEPAGSGDSGGRVGEVRPAGEQPDADRGGRASAEDRGAEPGQDAAPEARQQDGQGDQGGQGGDGAGQGGTAGGQQGSAEGQADRLTLPVKSPLDADAKKPARKAKGEGVKAKPVEAASDQPAIDREKLDKDFRTFPTQILNNLLERGEAAKLYKAAGVKGASAFGDLAMDDKAAAYVKFVQQGGKPVENLPKDYNAWVKSEERAAEVRRLQSDRVVRQENGKPFKSKTSAQQYQERYDLTGTHEVVAVDGGFELRQLSPAAQAELKRKAEGRESYTEAQAAVAEEMGIGQTPDGEWDATDEQFDEMERRVQARMRGEPAEPLLTNPTREDVLAQQERAENAQAADEREQIRRESEAGAGTFSLEMQDGRQDTTADLFRQTAPKPTRPAVSPNTIFTEDAAAKARERLRKKLWQLNSGLDPEMMMDGITLAGYHIEKGARTFAAYARAMLADLGDGVRPYLKSWYMGVKYDPRAAGFDGMDDAATVESADLDALTAQENDDVPGSDVRVERDRQEPAPGPAVGDAVPDDAGGSAEGNRADGGRTRRGGRRGQPDGAGVSTGGAVAGGERSDLGLPGGDPAAEHARVSTGADFGERGSDIGVDGVSTDPIPATQVDAVATRGDERAEREQAQRRADRIPVIAGNAENIRQTLPYLLAGQQEDVAKAEARFAQPDGYGMLFTNGTGTGKTFTGLGIVKRFERQGKGNVLIVVPDDKIASDWIESGRALGLTITALRDTKDAGRGITVTTYANLGENDALVSRQWDLFVADEAHELMKSADGYVTKGLAALRALSLHPDGAHTRYEMLNRPDIQKAAALDEQIKVNLRMMSRDDTMDVMVESLRRENQRMEAELAALYAKLDAARTAVREDVKSRQGASRPRAVFLSATPFAYEFNIDWANGYLFDYNEGQSDESLEFRGYNQGSNRDRFFMTHFGYTMRYNKLTKPAPSKVDTGLMQRQFNSWLKSRGVLSARMLDVPADYDRKFVLVDSAIGNRIDEALSWLDEQRLADKTGGFRLLRDTIDEKFDYLSRRYLLEAIKATESVPIVREHLRLGRKVVVFHDYKKGGGFNPFDIKPSDAPALDGERQSDQQAFNDTLATFREKFKDLVDAPLGRLPSPIEVFKREFPDVLLVNGDEKKADLLARYKKFQDDASGPQVMLVQSAKNKGWSGHDTTGKHQRVLINLGMPTAPTLAIQQEGRIYRTGQVSNAIIRYLNTGTNWERWAFATTIASRASTAENLAMGEQARALKDAFVAVFEESDAYPPGHEGEGTGGKARDAAANNALTAYDRAKYFYWATQKKNSKTKAQEGTDYFATPEPVGLKMAEWLALRGGEEALEPSAGHGAIARWLPDTVKRTAIEPSGALRARLAMVMSPKDDRIIDGVFEDHHVSNKYDGIVMNPPFGVGGKTAIEHLAKAATHLRDGGRIVALIPTGPAADKRYEQWMYGTEQRPVKPLLEHPTLGSIYAGDTVRTRAAWAPEGRVVRARDGALMVKVEGQPGESMVSLGAVTEVQPTGVRTREVRPAEGIYTVGEIRLPQVTFERAGTKVATRIVILEKQSDRERAPNARAPIDLTDVTDIRELFDRLERLEMPGRRMTAAQEQAAEAERAEQERARQREEARAKKAEPGAPKAANPDAVGTVDRAGHEIIEHVTQKGKTIRGIVRTDLLKEEAQKIDPYTFRKYGGWFIREVYLKSDDAPMASRGRAGGMTESAVRQVADTITSRWTKAPTVVVVPNMQDMRVPEAARQEDARQRAAGATGVPRAFYDRGTVYLVADGLKSVTDAAEALFHEALGHYGLRAVFGSALDGILDQIAVARPDLMRPKAKEYGKDLKVLKQRREVAEEVLAEMAQTKPNLGFVKRAIAAIRTWLRQNVPALKDMALTDAEIINNFILPARGWVERGERAMRPGGKVAMSRDGADQPQDQTQTEAFRRWFGDSKVVDADGNPLVVYHGTRADITTFDPERAGSKTDSGAWGRGIYFAADPEYAGAYAGRTEGSNIVPAYISLQNPLVVDARERTAAIRGIGLEVPRGDPTPAWSQQFANAVAQRGYDGVIVTLDGAPAEIVAFRPEQIKSATGNRGTFDPENPDIRFSRSTLGNTPPTPPQNPNAWQKLKAKALELTNPDAIESLIYEYQDKNIDLKRLRDHIKELGGTITDLNDAYLGEELYHKRLAKRTQDFLSEELKPLLADMRARGVDMPTLERYLHARHAPEANRVLAERNPNAQMIEAGKAKALAEVKALEVQLQRARAQGTATKAVEQALEQALAERDRWTGAQAFKGTEAERLSLSGMSDAEAAAFMGGLPAGQKVHLEALAARVDAMQAKTLEVLEKYGLMDKATLDAWRSTYQFYVPLHRDEAHPDAVSHPIGQGFSTKGDASKRRTGSNEKVTNILAHIAMQREAALTRGEKNRVAKKLYLMAAQNPDPEIWSVDKPPMMKTVDRETGFVRTTVDPTYRNKPNVVMVRIGGKDHAITFNERNPKAVRMAQSIKGADVGDLNAFESIMGKATRWLASVNTQYNPIFGIINFARDVQAAILQLSTTPLKGQERAVAAYVPAALKGIYAEVRSRRKGQSRGTGQWAKLWEDMQDEGGTTGYRELFITPDERVKALTKELNALERGKVSEAAHAVVDWLSDYNETMENAVRLAAYKVALDQGMSKERAASLAKNLTVNFNRRGRQTARLGAYYAFLNAAIQGTTRMVETLRGPLGRKIMLGGVMLGAVNALIGMAMMGGDDEEDNWEKIPDFVKERSLIVPLGREDYLAIPMPLGYHVFPNLGRKAVEMMMHDDPTKGVGSHIAEMLRITLDAFNPLGGSENLAQMVTPTPFDPAVALMMNRDWTGKPIYREDNSNLDPTPGHQRTKDTASAFSKAVSEALNKITGGTDYQPGAVSVTPDQIDYVIGQITGGLGREILKLENSITAPLTGDELPAYKIPLVGRLYGNTRGPANNAELFYEHVRELNQIENEIRGRARDGGDVAGYMAEEPLSALVGMGNAAENQIRKLRQYRAEVVRRAEPGYQDEVKRINEQMGEVMKLLNQEVRRAKMEAAAAQ